MVLCLFIKHALQVSSTSLPAIALSEALFGRKTQSGESSPRRAEQAYQKCRLCQGSKLVEKWGSATTVSMGLPPKSAAVNSCGDFSRIVTVADRPLVSSNWGYRNTSCGLSSSYRGIIRCPHLLHNVAGVWGTLDRVQLHPSCCLGQQER